MSVEFRGEIEIEGIDSGATGKQIIGNITGMNKFTQGLRTVRENIKRSQLWGPLIFRNWKEKDPVKETEKELPVS